MRSASRGGGRLREPGRSVPASAETTRGRPVAEGRPAPAAREPVSGPVPSDSQTDPSAGELVKQLTERTKVLVKQELRLAQVELQEKGKKVGIGAGLFGAGGLVGFFAAAALITATVLGLSTALAAWLSALIVGLVLLAAAGAAALTGKKQIEQATPPAPEQAIDSVKRDVHTVKRRARR